MIIGKEISQLITEEVLIEHSEAGRRFFKFVDQSIKDFLEKYFETLTAIRSLIYLGISLLHNTLGYYFNNFHKNSFGEINYAILLDFFYNFYKNFDGFFDTFVEIALLIIAEIPFAMPLNLFWEILLRFLL